MIAVKLFIPKWLAFCLIDLNNYIIFLDKLWGKIMEFYTSLLSLTQIDMLYFSFVTKIYPFIIFRPYRFQFLIDIFGQYLFNCSI